MDKIILYLFLLIWGNGLLSQKSYFQQEVNNIIKVRLDDISNTLTAEIQIEYINHSPDVLDKIGIHLWPNAYSSKQTAFCKQKILQRDLEFYDAPNEQLGKISGLDFEINGIKAKLESDSKNPDMAWLMLPFPLLPEERISIVTPFNVKIPKTFSRLGHVNQTYQITQWYPKPAVYDRKGWHLMPYLDQGEFYSEFGRFEVQISLPRNYVVGATGVLQNNEEKAFLNERIEESSLAIKQKVNLFSNKIPSSKEFKTITYIAEQVHDFAWFADKAFYVQKGEAILNSGKKVETWAMFNYNEYWFKAIQYLNRSIKFYSDLVGEYPWPQATAVESALSAGAGMEYPMITVIGNEASFRSLDNVITHEVGHNWFYGILASNEREHPFMDEGINTYYENRYMNNFYRDVNHFLPPVLEKWLGKIDEKELSFLIFARKYIDQYPNQNAENFNLLNYGTDVYMKTGGLFSYLEKYIGKDKYDELMQLYYNTWKFKHPYPEDLKSIFVKNDTNNLDWLFDNALNNNSKSDYKICKIETRHNERIITIKNKGALKMPFILSAMKNNEIVDQSWVTGFTGKNKLKISKQNIDKIMIDPKYESYDLYSNNNIIRTQGLFKKMEPIKLSILPIIDNKAKTEIGITPILGFNSYNGFMTGLYFSKPLIPGKYWDINLMPMYAFKSKSITGRLHASIRKYFLDGPIHNINIGVSAKRYGYDDDRINLSTLHYNKIMPYIEFNFRTDLKKSIDSRFVYYLNYIKDEVLSFKLDSGFLINQDYIIHQMGYKYKNDKILGPYEFNLGMEFQKFKSTTSLENQYLRIDLELTKKLRIAKKRYFEIRFASSFYPLNTQFKSTAISSRNVLNTTRGSAGLAFQGYKDNTNDELFLGRSDVSGIWSQQVQSKQGGFKFAHGLTQRDNIGNSNSFIFAVNLSSDLPIKKIGKLVRPYFDMGYSKINMEANQKYLYSAGINLSLFQDYLDLYLPIIQSKAIKELYLSLDHPTYFKQITFSLKLKMLSIKQLTQMIY